MDIEPLVKEDIFSDSYNKTKILYMFYFILLTTYQMILVVWALIELDNPARWHNGLLRKIIVPVNKLGRVGI